MTESCPACAHPRFRAWYEGPIRGGKEAAVEKCRCCGLGVFRGESPKEPMPRAPEGEQSRADALRRYQSLSGVSGLVLDYGCGQGEFLAQAGSRAHGFEIDLEVVQTLRVKGYPVYDPETPTPYRYGAVCLWHVLEHLEEPAKTLGWVKRLLKEGGEVYLEVPNADDALLHYDCPEFKAHYFWEHHRCYFTKNSLLHLAKRCGYEVLELTQVQRYPIGNHFGWLSEGKPGGHSTYSGLTGTPMDEAYSEALRQRWRRDTLWARLKPV